MPALDNPKHELFAQELSQGKSQTEAYEIVSGKKNRRYASELGQRQDISGRVIELATERAAMVAEATGKAVEKLALTKEWVIGRLMENAERALQHVPVMQDGKPTGEYRYEGAVANRSLEILAKHLGILVDKVEHSGVDGGPIETKDVSARELIERRVLGLASRAATQRDSSKPH